MERGADVGLFGEATVGQLSRRGLPGWRTGWRTGWRAAIMATGIAGTFWIGTGAAAAHVDLESSNPAAGAALSSPPERVKLAFSEPVRAGFARVDVTGPAGVSVSAGTPRIHGPVVRQELRPTMRAGRYVVAYRVVSEDGHPVAGKVEFTLSEGADRADRSSGASGSAGGESHNGVTESGGGGSDHSRDSNREGSQHQSKTDASASGRPGGLMPLALGMAVAAFVIGAAIFAAWGPRAR